MTLRELQLFSLEILKDVHQFCVDNQIPYSISDGTLIGAVRHKGFIPWDDDIDVIMRRPDFNRFCRIYKSPRFNLKYKELDNDSQVSYARVYDSKQTYARPISRWCRDEVGVCIDILPVDGLIEDKDECRKYYKRSRFYFICNQSLRIALNPFDYNKSFRYNVILFFKKVLSLNGLTIDWLCRKIINRAKAIEYGTTKYWGNLSSMCDGIMDYHRLEIFTSTTLIDFEDTKVMVMNGFEEYLRDKYNDYMKLPPKEKRTNHLMRKEEFFYWK